MPTMKSQRTEFSLELQFAKNIEAGYLYIRGSMLCYPTVTAEKNSL